MKKNQLSIRLYGEPVGVLEQLSTGKKVFTYQSSATMPLSIGMPIREEDYGDEQCEAFFGGLLPESETAKKMIGKKYGVSANNSFALLRAIGYDCAGAISCHKIDEPIISQQSVLITGKIISNNKLYQHIKDLHSKPLFMDVKDLRLSLAGVQDKAAVCLLENQVAFPTNGCPTTHILKPASPHYVGLVENEYFCLKIAKRIGLNVSEVELRKVNDIPFLLIERYDRRITNKHIARIHQEDFCQALGVKSSNKYQNEGGPGFKECFDLLMNTTLPAVDRNHLASAIVFNYLIYNMDAHAKNFSLLHNPQSNIRLAPFYDLVCTGVYENLGSKMAMKIGSNYDAKHVFPRHWEALCESVNYRYLSMKDLILKLSTEIMIAASVEREILKDQGFNNLIINKIMDFIEININKTVKSLATAS